MDEERDAQRPLHDALGELAEAIDAWQNELTTLATALRAMQTRMTADELEGWALATCVMDRETLHDFLAFDGNVASGVTDRMLAYLQRVVDGLN